MLKCFAYAMLFGILLFISYRLDAQSPIVCLTHLNVQEAYQEKWLPGIVSSNKEASGGMIYQISFTVRKKGNIIFNNLIVDNKILNIEVVRGSERNAKGPFKKGDHLQLIARTDRKAQAIVADNSIITILKEKNAQSGLLYNLGEQQYIFPIKKFDAKVSKKLSQ